MRLIISARGPLIADPEPDAERHMAAITAAGEISQSADHSERADRQPGISRRQRPYRSPYRPACYWLTVAARAWASKEAEAVLADTPAARRRN